MSDRNLLLKGGRVVSLDPEIGHLPLGDVLIAGSEVVRVSQSIDEPDAEVFDASNMIAIPGFIDTHRHTWQTAIKSMSSDWSLPEYLAGIRGRLGPRFSPEDVYAATLLGATEALNAGVTTLVDWAHIMNSPEHADGSVAALKEFGGRECSPTGRRTTSKSPSGTSIAPSLTPKTYGVFGRSTFPTTTAW